jgi:hypothetical protein
MYNYTLHVLCTMRHGRRLAAGLCMAWRRPCRACTVNRINRTENRNQGALFQLIVPLFRLPMPLFQLPVPVIQLPVPSYRLPVPYYSSYPSPYSNYPCPYSNYPCPYFRLPVPLFQLPVPLFQLPVPLFQLPVPLFQLPVPVLRLSAAPNIHTEVRSGGAGEHSRRCCRRRGQARHGREVRAESAQLDRLPRHVDHVRRLRRAWASVAAHTWRPWICRTYIHRCINRHVQVDRH